MKNLKIYNTRQARKDLKTGNTSGLETAIAKWQSFFDIIAEIRGEALAPCGLCLTHELCHDCPTENCGDAYVMKDAMKSLKYTQYSIENLIEYLEELD